jgi:hypothetical protein
MEQHVPVVEIVTVQMDNFVMLTLRVLIRIIAETIGLRQLVTKVSPVPTAKIVNVRPGKLVSEESVTIVEELRLSLETTVVGAGTMHISVDSHALVVWTMNVRTVSTVLAILHVQPVATVAPPFMRLLNAAMLSHVPTDKIVIVHEVRPV